MGLYTVTPESGDHQGWVQPHEWGGEVDPGVYEPKPTSKPSIQLKSNNNDVPLINPDTRAMETFYVKLVNYIFNEKKMKKDPTTGKLFRIIHFEINEEQLKLLKSSFGNVREVDGIVFDVLKDSNEGFIVSTAEFIFTISEKIYFFFWETLEEFHFYMYAALIVLMIVILKRHNKRWNIVLLSLGIIFMISFKMEYNNCNKRLKVEKLLKLSIKEKNACDFNQPQTYYESFKSFFGRQSSKEKCIDQLM